MITEVPCGSSRRHFLDRLISITVLREMLVDDLIPLGKGVSVETTAQECEQIPILDVAVCFAICLPELGCCLGDDKLWSIQPIIWSDNALYPIAEGGVRVRVLHDVWLGQLYLPPIMTPFTEGLLEKVRHDP